MSDGTQLFLRGRQVLRTQLADVDRLCDLVWKHIADGTAHRLNWQAIVQSADPPLPWNAKFVHLSPSISRRAYIHTRPFPRRTETAKRSGGSSHTSGSQGARQTTTLYLAPTPDHSSTATDHRHPARQLHCRASQRWTGRRATWRTRRTCSI